MTHVIKRYLRLPPPNNSSPIAKEARGVLVPPQNTPIIPSPATKDSGKLNKGAKKLPNVAPTTNSGVTSPP